MKIRIDNDLELVPIHLDFAKEIFESFDNEIIRFLPVEKPPEKIEDTISFIERSMEQIRNGTDLVWVILHQKQFSGCCGIHTIKSGQPHFGLWIKKEHQAKGIGKRVVHHMLQWAISNLDIEFVKYPVDKRNVISLRLIEGLGLKLSDQYELGKGKKLEVVEYRLYK